MSTSIPECSLNPQSKIVCSLNPQSKIVRQQFPYSYDRVYTRISKLQSKYPHLSEEDVTRMILQSKTTDGELVGVVAGQSLGERVTQLTLNTFHSAGMTEDTVSSGVPRVIELLNLTQLPRFSPKRKVSLALYDADLSDPEQVYDLFRACERNMVHRTMKDVIVCKSRKPYRGEWWYEGTYSPDINWTVFEVILDTALMVRLELSLEELVDMIQSTLDTFAIETSPWSLRSLHIITSSPSTIYQRWSSIEQCPIRGIPNCVAYTIHSSDMLLQSIGCHLSQFLGTRRVNMSKSYSNDIWEMFIMFGIECVRNFIIHEICSIIDNIQLHHVILIADVMTWNGTPTPLNRFGIHHINTSILSKCTFERPINVIVDGACANRRETIDSVSASVMCGTLGTYGTGSVHVVLDT